MEAYNFSGHNRPVITVPLTEQYAVKKYITVRLPEQSGLEIGENLTLTEQTSDVSEFTKQDSIVTGTGTESSIAQMKKNYQKNLITYEKLKQDLKDRQNQILDMYTKMRNTQKMMSVHGQNLSLPSTEELHIMNVGKLQHNQLLKVCGASPGDKSKENSNLSLPHTLSLDLGKLSMMPNKLVATCEQTIMTKKDIIDWFDSLRTMHKGIHMTELSNKINEFNAENEMLYSALQNIKSEFLNDVNEIVDYLRKCADETVRLQIGTDQLKLEVTELKGQNTDLRKQLQAVDHLKSLNARHKIEELEKKVKEEKCKQLLLNNRIAKADGQVKIGMERASQLEQALEDAHARTFDLEQNIKQLNAQNEKLQSDFNQELNKLTESIKENTLHLEEIAAAREKLQDEKEELEKRLRELSERYNESLTNMKVEVHSNVAKLIETEKKFEEEKEERAKLDNRLKCLCNELLDSELRYKELLKQLKDKENELSKALLLQPELETTKRELNLAQRDIDDYRNRLMKQSDTIREIERDFKEAVCLENTLKHDLHSKVDYIKELEKKEHILEQQLQESECKMCAYQEQLTALKEHISQLKKDFGEFESINELHDMINKQRANLLEATRQNGELAETVQKKDYELERHIETLTVMEQQLEQKDGEIKMLTDKEEKQTILIQALQNNMEMRAQTDNEISQKLTDKNSEIESLKSTANTRKLQISQLKKIVLTLEEQLRSLNLQKRQEQQKIKLLEKTITEYEYFQTETKRNIEVPAENLDNLIKLLEDELGTPFDGQSVKESETRKYDKRDINDYREGKENTYYHNENDRIPTKIVMGNYIRKTHTPTNDEHYKGDTIRNSDRKKAWYSTQEQGLNIYSPVATTPIPKEISRSKGVLSGEHKERITRNLQFIMPNQFKDEKKSKMFKLAGHKL